MKYTVQVLLVVDLGEGVAFEGKKLARWGVPPRAVTKAEAEMADALHFCVQHACGEIAANLANGDVDPEGRRFHVALDVCWPHA